LPALCALRRSKSPLLALLERQDCQVVLADSSQEALRQLLERDFALVVLDVQMPILDGFETARLIRQRERSSRTPIIFLTAHDKAEQKVLEGYAAGAVDYVFKPVVPAILRGKVRVFLELARMRQRLEGEVAERQRLVEQLRAEHRAALNLMEEAVEARRRAEQVSVDLRKENTERQASEAALRESEERFRTLVEHAPDGVVIHIDYSFVYLNRKATSLFGAGSPAELVGQPVLERVHPDFLAPARERIRLVYEQQASVPKTHSGICGWMARPSTRKLPRRRFASRDATPCSRADA
jgi:DNA-binding response OmpR family regulator